MLKFLTICILGCLIGLASAAETAATVQTPAVNFESSFQEGVQQYQAQKYPEAKTSLGQAISAEPLNVAALTNLALVEYQLGNKGYALGILRKVHALDPGFSTAQSALTFITAHLDIKEIPHEIRWNETVRSEVLSVASGPTWMIFTALLVFAACWTLLGYFGKRKRAFQEEQPYPPAPILGVIFALFAIAGLFFSTLKVMDLRTSRATVLTDKTTVRSGPDEKAPAIFELYSGLEVVIEGGSDQSGQKWFQVNYPGGMTGWVPATAVYVTSVSGKGDSI